LGQELLLTLRGLAKRPAFTVAVLLLLVLGIGTNTAIWSLLDAIFLHPLPAVAAPREVVAIYQTTLGENGLPASSFDNVSYPNYRDFRDRNRSFSDVALYQWLKMNLAGGATPERIAGMFATANYFDVLGVRPAHGRFFRPEEVRVPGAEAVAVLGHGCFSRLFGGDPKAVGRSILLDGRKFTVVGVAPPGFRGTDLDTQVDVWVPVTMFPVLSSYYPAPLEERNDLPFRAFGRLKPGVSLAEAEADMAGLARVLARQFPKEDEKLGVRLLPLVEGAILPREQDRYRGYGRTLSFAAVLLLIVVSANVANLLLARGVERGPELAIRQAVGGNLSALARLLAIESLLLFSTAVLLSLPAGVWSLRLLWGFRPPELATGDLDLHLDPTLFAGTVLFTLVIVLLFGLVPVLRTARRGLARCLAETRLAEPRPRLWHPRRLAVVLQLALTLFALIGANLLLAGLLRTRHADLGFQPEGLLALSVAPGDQGYDPARARGYYRELLERVAALPGVRGAALSENRLLRGAILSRSVYPEGQAEGITAGGRSSHRTNIVTPGFFRVAGIALLHGRDFAEIDCAGCRRVAIVNQTLARLAWPGQDPLGRRFRFEQDKPPIEVVGVAKDAKYRNIREDPLPFIYLPLSQNDAASMTLHVRTDTRPEAALLPALRNASQAIDPGMPLAEIDTMTHFISGALWMERVSALLLGLFGLFALLLSGIGIYTVITLSAARRRREIGIRLALGARPSQMTAAVLAEAAVLAGAGLVLGWAAARFFLQPILASHLQGADLWDPKAYAAQSLVLLATAIAASIPPALRAARVNPATPLREG
jgi:putative ABC transport system permease protein